MTFSLPGWKVSCYFRSGSECSREQKFHLWNSSWEPFASGSRSTWDRKFRNSSITHLYEVHSLRENIKSMFS